MSDIYTNAFNVPPPDDAVLVAAALRDELAAAKAENAKLRAIAVLLADALEESHALTINWTSEADPQELEYYSEYKRVIEQAAKALAQHRAASDAVGGWRHEH